MILMRLESLAINVACLVDHHSNQGHMAKATTVDSVFFGGHVTKELSVVIEGGLLSCKVNTLCHNYFPS